MPTSDHFAAAELARLCAEKGVRNAVISPGSRNAPLIIAFNAHPEIKCHQVIDERSAGFFALGMAQQLHAPVALVCTSGSAVLNYGPAVAEAFYQRIPLLLITADRPQEWLDQGEGQAIRQHGALNLHVKSSVQLPRLLVTELEQWECGRLINVAIDNTLIPVSGPVHVNVPFEEPLYGTIEKVDLPVRTIAQVMTESFVLPEHARWLIQQLATKQKVLILAGQGLWSDGLKKQLQVLASLPQISVHTEATSNLDDNAFITCIDRVIEGVDDTNSDKLKPDLLISFGGAIVSKRVKTLLRNWAPAQHWRVDIGQRHFDTYQCLTHDIAVSPEVFFAQVSEQVRSVMTQLQLSVETSSTCYQAAWNAVDERTNKKHYSILESSPFCDLTVFRTLLERIPERSDVHLANSTPARYVQLFERTRNQRFFSNRGASGIDGCTSTAVGAAFVQKGPTTLITGDVAFCYDSNAFWNDHLSPHLRVIVIDNGGGNIFRYIEGPDKDPALLKWFESPHDRDIEKLVRSFHLPYFFADNEATLKQALDAFYEEMERPAVLHIKTDAEVSPMVLRNYFKELKGS